MIRLHALVEGQTEEAFFNRVLRPHLAAFDVYADVRVINPKTGSSARKNKGGWNSYAVAKKDLLRWMKEDSNQDAWFTSMVDLYKIPGDFPKQEKAKSLTDSFARVVFLEKAWYDDVCTDTLRHFIPYIQLHEFEALLLTDPQKLDWAFLEHDEAIKSLVRMVSGYKSPELINDGPETAPSKRIIKAIPEYEGRKVSAGPLVADKIGLPLLRQHCRHFNDWLAILENLGRPCLDVGCSGA